MPFYLDAKLHLESNHWLPNIHLNAMPIVLKQLLLRQWSHCHFLLLPGGTWNQTHDLMILIQILCQVCCSCSYWNSGQFAIFSLCQVAPGIKPMITWYSFTYYAKYVAAAPIETLVYLPFSPYARWHLVSNTWSNDINSSVVPNSLQLLAGHWN